MRRRTFERLCQKWEAIEERKDELFLPGFLNLARRLGIDWANLMGKPVLPLGRCRMAWFWPTTRMLGGWS
jgi:hypothetical protein